MNRLLPTLVCLGVLAGCSEAGDEPPWVNPGSDVLPLHVGAINAPLAYFAERLGGEKVLVTQLAPAGEDPAEWIPGPEDVLEMQGMDLILLNGAGYEPWLDQVSLAADKLVDTSGGLQEELIFTESVTHQHGPQGAHSHGASAFTTWLDPLLAIGQARAISTAIGAVISESGVKNAQRLAALEADLMQLHEDWELAVEPLQGEVVMFSHPVYQYFERRYAVNGESVHWEPDEAPDASQWVAFEELLNERPTTVMIWERQPLATSVMKFSALGIRLAVIDPAGNTGSNADYLSIQRANVESLRSALSN